MRKIGIIIIFGTLLKCCAVDNQNTIKKQVIRDFEAFGETLNWNVSHREFLIRKGSPMAYVFDYGVSLGKDGSVFYFNVGMLCPEIIVSDMSDVLLYIDNVKIPLNSYEVMVKPEGKEVVSDILLTFKIDRDDFKQVETISIEISGSKDVLIHDASDFKESVLKLGGGSVVHRLVRF